jgi:hypothetical protein
MRSMVLAAGYNIKYVRKTLRTCGIAALFVSRYSRRSVSARVNPRNDWTDDIPLNDRDLMEEPGIQSRSERLDMGLRDFDFPGLV